VAGELREGKTRGEAEVERTGVVACLVGVVAWDNCEKGLLV
jgi:hypothetical protein